MPEDTALLRLYTDSRSEAAFATLVRRHLPLVYSAALRQVGGDVHRAQEVTQAVFTLLARKAGELHGHPALSGWLYLTTHHIAAKATRSEQRRHRREKEAQAMHDQKVDSPASASWEQTGPVIDELMLQLPEGDRTAVILRYFENRPWGEIGARLGLSENAARMRVDRALDGLRSALARRGIVSTAAALGGTLASQAVMTPPAGLAAAISASAAATTIGGLALFMSSPLLKTGLVAAVIVAGTTGLVWQQRENTRLRNEVKLLQAAVTNRARQEPGKDSKASAAPLERHAQVELARLRAELEELRMSPANSWQDRVSQLRQLLAMLPEMNIPEIQLATEDDWLEAAKGELETEADYRRALATLRTMAIRRFTNLVRPALVQYLQSHGNEFPTDVASLQSYLERPIDAAIWQRYEILPASTMSNVKVGGDWIITQRGSGVDEEYDMKFVIGPFGSGATTYGALTVQAMLDPVVKAFAAANPGKNLSHPADLLPYATTQAQRDVIQKSIKKLGGK